jgi:hypothetical protein
VRNNTTAVCSSLFFTGVCTSVFHSTCRNEAPCAFFQTSDPLLISSRSSNKLNLSFSFIALSCRYSTYGDKVVLAFEILLLGFIAYYTFEEAFEIYKSGLR